jgi:hypothetical protein
VITCPHCGKDFSPAPSLELDGQKGKRGMRLPDDFVPPDDWMRWARQNRPGVDATLQAQLFVNFWTAKTGAQACKRDWFATWRNWILQCRLDPKAVPAPRVNLPQSSAPARKPAPPPDELSEEQREAKREANRKRIAELAQGVVK